MKVMEWMEFKGGEVDHREVEKATKGMDHVCERIKELHPLKDGALLKRRNEPLP